MDRATYEREAQVEETHWWFVGRRALFARVLAENAVPRDAAILDVGSGTGATLRLLRDQGFRNVTGLDKSAVAQSLCRDKGLGEVQLGSVTDLPFPAGSFDVVFATDIVEHVADDAAALRELARVLVPRGLVVITVPAFQSLWGLQDEVSHHHRRYRSGQVLDLVHDAGLKAIQSHYFNFLLFVPIWLARQSIRLLGVRAESENDINTTWINAVLTKVFRLDIAVARRVNPPFGVSFFALCRKPGLDEAIVE